MDYPILLAPLSEEDGGGFVGLVPDLPGCMSDGKTAEEALANTQQAILEWIDTARRRDLPLPAPGSSVRRARHEKERLVADLKDLAGNLDQIECRVDELERVLREVEERLDHEEEWARFAEITVLPVRSAKPLKGSA